jgi:cold shock CspA family protein
MLLPLQISFRKMDASPELEKAIREKAAHLDTFVDYITSCRVVIEPAGKHHLHGNQYEVHIDVTLPGGEVAASREPGNHQEYKDVAVAIRDAFDAVKRQLEDHVRRTHGRVKSHTPMAHARVSNLPETADYGFLTTLDGREIYFHRNSVLHDQFDHLSLGTEVAFVEEEGDKGAQATTVRVVGRHSHV